MKNYYSILGINPSATEEEIKSSYRKLARKHHPDRGGDTSKFQEIQEAYSVLGDPKKRREYDNPRSSGVHYGDFGNFDDISPEDIFDMFGVHVHRRGRARKPTAITMSLWVSLEDVAKQNKKVISVNTGRHNEHVEIDIPPAIDDGSSVRYPKLIKGERDLIINFKITPNQTWERSDLNLLTEYSINIWDLILGTSVTVQTIYGSQIKLKIPPETQPQTIMKIAKHGLKDRSGNIGDMFVKLVTFIPKNIPDSLKEAIKDCNKQNN